MPPSSREAVTLVYEGTREFVPALPPVAKVIRTDFQFTLGGNTNVRDRIYFAYAGAGPSVAELTTLGSTISTAWSAHMAARQHTSCTLTSIELTDLTSASAAQVTGATSVAGTAGSGAPVAAASLVIKFRIARRYRGGHPRLYFPGVSTGNLATDETWDPTYASGTVTAWAAFITACELSPPAGVGAMTHVNVSYFLGFTPLRFPSGRYHNVPTLRGTPVQDAVIAYGYNSHVASQRRRNQTNG
jgi:hypothetical protein